MQEGVDLQRIGGLDLTEELFTVLHRCGGASVERIVSNGQQTAWYDQDHDEWVMVVTGAAVLDVDGAQVRLEPGHALTLAAHVRHRVVWTASPTVWVAVHFPA